MVFTLWRESNGFILATPQDFTPEFKCLSNVGFESKITTRFLGLVHVLPEFRDTLNSGGKCAIQHLISWRQAMIDFTESEFSGTRGRDSCASSA